MQNAHNLFFHLEFVIEYVRIGVLYLIKEFEYLSNGIMLRIYINQHTY